MIKALISLLITVSLSTVCAQVTFQKYPVPDNADNDNYRLVTDYYSDQQVLFPITNADTVYVKHTANGNFNPLAQVGLYITAFYANNGDLFVVENKDTNGYAPHLYKSVDNGTSFTEISGVSGRVFHRDQYGTLFYSTADGLAFSNDNGANFDIVTTPDTVYTACKSSSGTLFFIADSFQLYRSVDNGLSWQNISKSSSWNGVFNERSIWEMNDTLYFQSANQLYYTTESDTKWTGQVINSGNSIITNLQISPDQVCFVTSPYGFLSSNTPSSRNLWTQLAPFVGGKPNSNIYNHFITITDSAMYLFNDTTYLYASRTPNFVGISDAETTFTLISVYPNPSNGKVYIESKDLNQPYDIFVYDNQGRLVLTRSKVLTDRYALNIEKGPGVYFILITCKGEKSVFSIMKF